MSEVRVRFAPSPTGGLHIGGLRTALFNYLFARNQKGKFILRIEDTDQNRFVEGAEEYIINALKWIGLTPDEGPVSGGEYGPYRQSERKALYKEYVDKLLVDGNAYYAFDTTEELEAMRERVKADGISNPQYDALTRGQMKNSLTLSEAEVQTLLDAKTPYVIRAKIPAKAEIRFKDTVRDWVKVHGAVLDDKVLMKSDGMPTYHLANVVDDFLMKITHVIRGEEWLPSTPLHVLLYQFFGWEDKMPQFAHLPLILKPDGNGKLSKRAADKAGFPIFPLDWQTPGETELIKGFKEEGYLPEALRNFLVLLGWNPGSDKEIFSLPELEEIFSLQRINKAGTKFDIDKAKWFNQQYIKTYSEDVLADIILADLDRKHQIIADKKLAVKIVNLLKERVTFPQEFADNSLYLFQHPETFDEKITRKKWNEEAKSAMNIFIRAIRQHGFKNAEEAKTLYSETLNNEGLNPGKHMQVLRICVTGEGSGPDLMGILAILGTESTINRIKNSIGLLDL